MYVQQLVTAVLIRDWVRPPFFIPQTQTERDSESKADPETLSGFDNWNDIPLDVTHFLERVGPGMEHELTKSDASQVSRQGVVYALCNNREKVYSAPIIAAAVTNIPFRMYQNSATFR